MPTLLLPNSKPLTAPHWRAYADVYATNSTGSVKTSVFQCLVDTGSDYTILPNHVAATIGINLATAPTIVMKSFRTAIGATYALPYHPSIDLVIEGYMVNVGVAFSTAAFSPILGRIDAVSTFDIGFDASNWYWT